MLIISNEDELQSMKSGSAYQSEMTLFETLHPSLHCLQTHHTVYGYAVYIQWFALIVNRLHSGFLYF